MRRLVLLISAVFLMALLDTSRAAEGLSKTIHLRCAYSYSIDIDGKSSGTSGESLFTVIYTEDGQAKIRKQGLGVEFSGKISEEEIVGDVVYQATDIQLSQSLVINRFTGAFKISFGTVGQIGVIHFGTCHPVTKPLF